MTIPKHKTAVTLQTSNGQHVCYAGVPPFETAPDIVMWGQRFFRLLHKKKMGEMAIYRETFVAVILPEEVDLGPAPVQREG